MKPITIRNQEYYYLTSMGRTFFYKTSIIDVPIFEIDKVITDPKYTKQDIIGFITQGLKIMDRKLEIERGEII